VAFFGGGHYNHPDPYLNSTIVLFDKFTLIGERVHVHYNYD